MFGVRSFPNWFPDRSATRNVAQMEDLVFSAFCFKFAWGEVPPRFVRMERIRFFNMQGAAVVLLLLFSRALADPVTTCNIMSDLNEQKMLVLSANGTQVYTYLLTFMYHFRDAFSYFYIHICIYMTICLLLEVATLTRSILTLQILIFSLLIFVTLFISLCSKTLDAYV